MLKEQMITRWLFSVIGHTIYQDEIKSSGGSTRMIFLGQLKHFLYYIGLRVVDYWFLTR
jgi:hypothetical protein